MKKLGAKFKNTARTGSHKQVCKFRVRPVFRFVKRNICLQQVSAPFLKSLVRISVNQWFRNNFAVHDFVNSRLCGEKSDFKWVL